MRFHVKCLEPYIIWLIIIISIIDFFVGLIFQNLLINKHRQQLGELCRTFIKVVGVGFLVLHVLGIPPKQDILNSEIKKGRKGLEKLEDSKLLFY